jgi:hypothetical protein
LRHSTILLHEFDVSEKNLLVEKSFSGGGVGGENLKNELFLTLFCCPRRTSFQELFIVFLCSENF